MCLSSPHAPTVNEDVISRDQFLTIGEKGFASHRYLILSVNDIQAAYRCGSARGSSKGRASIDPPGRRVCHKYHSRSLRLASAEVRNSNFAFGRTPQSSVRRLSGKRCKFFPLGRTKVPVVSLMPRLPTRRALVD